MKKERGSWKTELIVVALVIASAVGGSCLFLKCADEYARIQAESSPLSAARFAGGSAISAEGNKTRDCFAWADEYSCSAENARWKMRGEEMTITIPGYTIELDYFPGTPGDERTAPTEEDFEIIQATATEKNTPLSRLEEHDLVNKKWHQIIPAIHAKLEKEAAQSQFEAAEYRMDGGGE